MKRKTILITGTSSGVGKSTTKLFQAQGWNVIATMRTPEKESELSQLENTFVTRLDVIDEASISSAILQGINRFGKIDVLLNNAGYGSLGPLEAFDIESIKKQFETNVFGLLAVTKAIIPHFRSIHNGTLINISSMGCRVTLPLGSVYHGTKYAVEGISEALFYELETIGVKVKIVEPGAIKTNFLGDAFDIRNDESINEYQNIIQRFFTASSFMEKASTPEDVAQVIWNAATDGSNTLRYIAGSDALEFLSLYDKISDNEFFDIMKSEFGIEV
ncbi:SDR family oxidoreductase [Dysgonomonas capnocytophagoides]|uniref:SDR family oxidoreductase n=1 Tax=Dysgonomonas capnocytophagoides TaxID=45254 RepID=UPI0030C7FE7E